jgi:hypothetical protein
VSSDAGSKMSGGHFRFRLMLGTFSGHLLAETEGRPCIPEPTDDFMEYGDLITCSVSPIGDSDFFRFIGENGEKIVVLATQGGGGNTPDPCIELYRPDGTLLSSDCDEVIAVIETTLDMDGQYVLLVSEWGNDQAMTHNVGYNCIFGVCLETIEPFCNIQMSQTNYVDGDTVTAEVFRLANPRPDPVRVEWKVWESMV